MTKISSGGGVFNSLATRRVARLGAVTGLGLSAFAVAAIAPGVFATGSTNGATRVEMEVATSIAMKITSPNDVDPDCIAEAGKTYGVANRYASSTGEGGKVVDTFNGNEGEADELNTNTSCAKLSMEPNNFDSTYSDVTVFTNSPSGYALTVQSAENVSPNLVNVSDNTQYIPAGTLTENNGTVTGGQNKWAYKTNNGIITDWTAMSTTPAPIKAYDNYTEGGDTTRVTYGISTGNNPTGTYTTELTYTATMFDGINPYTNYMQDFSADSHATDPVNTEYTVFDSRDQKQYRAAKLADGNIWMTEDLKLGGDSAITLTPANSDVSSNYTLPAENTGAWCVDDTAACDNQSLMRKTGAPNGYLYNWYAATAGTGTYELSSGNATASICPKGWKLPTNDQYVALDQAYGGSGSNRTGDTAQVNKFMASPLNFNYTGLISYDSVVHPSEHAQYWSRTADSGIIAYDIVLYSDGLFYPLDRSRKFYGFAVRCVAETPTMQSFSAAVHSSDAVGTTYKLKDSRDNQEYTAAKLADGNIWMTKDLKLDGGRTLTSADSDVTTSFNLLTENTDAWCTDSSAACNNQSLMIKTGVPNGYLYNWYAATAGSGTYELTDGIATASICPKGWKLPTGGKIDYDSQFARLLVAYGGTGIEDGSAVANALMAQPVPGFNYTNNREGATMHTGSGRYWSSRAHSNSHAWRLVLTSTGAGVNGANVKYSGFAVRCIAAS